MNSEVDALASGPVQRLGVVGTLVWDTIRGIPGQPELEDWGGIAYALAALEGVLPSHWEVLPLLKVGRDLEGPALQYLEGFTRLSGVSGVDIVDAPNNRVTLRYSPEGRRVEQLRGGVPGWTWAELEPHLASLDALYVNFISGFEMTLDDAGRLPGEFGGPTHADLHSLFLGVGPGGDRFLRSLPDVLEWARCFDSIQMNEDEFALFAGEAVDPWEWARGLVGGLPKAILVTLGAGGAGVVASPGAWEKVARWSELRSLTPTELAEIRRVPAVPQDGSLDPTGCGDVWGASFFGDLLACKDLIVSMKRANQLARRNVSCRGSSAFLSSLRERAALGERVR